MIQSQSTFLLETFLSFKGKRGNYKSPDGLFTDRSTQKNLAKDLLKLIKPRKPRLLGLDVNIPLVVKRRPNIEVLRGVDEHDVRVNLLVLPGRTAG